MGGKILYYFGDNCTFVRRVMLAIKCYCGGTLICGNWAEGNVRMYCIVRGCVALLSQKWKSSCQDDARLFPNTNTIHLFLYKSICEEIWDDRASKRRPSRGTLQHPTDYSTSSYETARNSIGLLFDWYTRKITTTTSTKWPFQKLKLNIFMYVLFTEWRIPVASK